MMRRAFIAGLGSAVAWPIMARAQQPERMRRNGILYDYPEADPEGRTQITAFREELLKLGWIEGRSVELDIRPSAVDADLVRTYAIELTAQGPDVVLAAGGTIVGAVQRASRNVPIVFVN